MLSCGLDVELSQGSRNLGVWSCGYHHDISVTSERINVSSEPGVPNFHSLKLRLSLGTAKFKLFNNV